MEDFWNQRKLYFHQEFINQPGFSESKKNLLKQFHGTYYINNDFIIYQEKSMPFDRINKTDSEENLSAFIRILHNLPFDKVEEFIKFHYDRYPHNKNEFLVFLYHEIKGSIVRRGDKIIPNPQQFDIVLKWCESRLDGFTKPNQADSSKTNRFYVNNQRIEAIREINDPDFDYSKLIRLLEEINTNFSARNFMSVSMLVRAVLDHVPPLFGFDIFNKVANNYGGQSFKKNMKHLNDSMRSIADSYLHLPIRKKESIPNEIQVDFSRELDFLLSEIIRIRSI